MSVVLAGIYCRISDDREGAGLGVARQETDCRALCQRKGWTVTDVYTDNDVSAYSGAPRPSWDHIVADARAGTINAIAAWHVDRLTRTPRELEDVIQLAEDLGLQLATATGDIDLATPTGRMVARMLGAAARHESEHKGERQRREHRQRAEAGAVSGGGWRPFGYEHDRVTIRASEAAILREAAARALAGESLASICRDLKTRGVQTSGGTHFRPTTLRDVLCSARISGRREHIPRHTYRGKARPLVGEIVATAVWPAIIAPEHSDRLREVLTRPDRLTRAGTGRTYLLSGILRCGRCGFGLVGRPRSGTPRYVCPNVPGNGSCGSMATGAAATDTLIRDMLLQALATGQLAERLRERQRPEVDLGDRIRQAEDRLDELAADYAAGELSRSEWRAARDVLDKQLRRDRDALAADTRSHALDGFGGGTVEDLRRRWDALGIGQRRALAGACIERIVVHPADRRKRWDPDRFEVVWRA